MFPKFEGARRTKIKIIKVVAAICIARRPAHAVGHGVGVAVDVIADEHRERPRCLQGRNHTELEVSQEAALGCVGR